MNCITTRVYRRFYKSNFNYVLIKNFSVKEKQQENVDNKLLSYECPVYCTPVRGRSFITAIRLPSRHPPKHWIMQGTALVTQHPE